MTQNKFDVAEFLVNNKAELFSALEPELVSVLEIKPWFVKNDLELSYEDAFADWLTYKIVWLYIDNSGKSYEDAAAIVDKNLIADVFGENVLKSSTWEKK